MTKSTFLWAQGPGGKRREIHQYGPDGKPTIVLLHELAGVTLDIDDLARELEQKGYRVLVPVMLPARGLLNVAIICLSAEFTTFASGRSSLISEWLREFCSGPASEQGRRRVAVIGMCATGGIVLSVLFDASVVAGVAAQPSLPFRVGKRRVSQYELGASEQDAKASARSGKRLLTMRFERDRICPRDRIDGMRELWIDAGAADRFVSVEFPHKGHSTLTLHRACAIAGDETSRDILFRFLSESLPANQDPKSGDANSGQTR